MDTQKAAAFLEHALDTSGDLEAFLTASGRPGAAVLPYVSPRCVCAAMVGRSTSSWYSESWM